MQMVLVQMHKWYCETYQHLHFPLCTLQCNICLFTNVLVRLYWQQFRLTNFSYVYSSTYTMFSKLLDCLRIRNHCQCTYNRLETLFYYYCGQQLIYRNRLLLTLVIDWRLISNVIIVHWKLNRWTLNCVVRCMT